MTRKASSGSAGLVIGVILTAAGCALIPAGGGNTNDNTDDNTNGNDNTSGAKLVVFDDPDSDFETSDVRDVEGEIVQFDEEAQALIWAEDGASFEPGTWVANGNLLRGVFEVRFGTEAGERRAYFTEESNGFICNIEPAGTSLSISGTTVPVPQE